MYQNIRTVPVKDITVWQSFFQVIYNTYNSYRKMKQKPAEHTDSHE